MQELIKINEGKKVDARELHKFLQIGTAYKDWFPRMCEYGFVEGVDFNPLKIEQVQKEGTRKVCRDIVTHEITLDMAKEIAMIQRSELGKQARQYFIECEKKYKAQRTGRVLSAKELEIKSDNAMARRMNAVTAQAKIWMQIAKDSTIDSYREIAHAYAANTLAGREVFELPMATRKTYTSTEIGEMLGISSNMVGRLANKYNLKTDEYGALFLDKSPYSSKQVEVFRYYDSAVEQFRKIVENQEQGCG